MKKTLLFLVILSMGYIGSSSYGQDRAINHGVGLGYQLIQFQRDFGLGLNFTSPYFAKDRIAVRIRGNLMFNENVQDQITTWTPYSNASLGLIGVGGMIGDHVRLYGEGGIVGLFPSADFSSERFEFGGYGLFGFEFFMNRASNYFIEIGGIGSGAIADRIENQPIYSNGLIISTGFRIHLE